MRIQNDGVGGIKFQNYNYDNLVFDTGMTVFEYGVQLNYLTNSDPRSQVLMAQGSNNGSISYGTNWTICNSALSPLNNTGFGMTSSRTMIIEYDDPLYAVSVNSDIDMELNIDYGVNYIQYNDPGFLRKMTLFFTNANPGTGITYTLGTGFSTTPDIVITTGSYTKGIYVDFILKSNYGGSFTSSKWREVYRSSEIELTP